MQDIIATAFEAAGVPHVDPSSPRTQPPLTRRSGEAGRRAALAGRLFRLCSPVALQVVHDMGVATTMSACGASSCSWLVCLCVPLSRAVVCVRRLLRHSACDVGAACCELLPPRCYCLRIIPPPLTPLVLVDAESPCVRTGAVAVVRTASRHSNRGCGGTPCGQAPAAAATASGRDRCRVHQACWVGWVWPQALVVVALVHGFAAFECPSHRMWAGQRNPASRFCRCSTAQ